MSVERESDADDTFEAPPPDPMDTPLAPRLPVPPPLPPPVPPRLVVVRNTPRDTWGWLWKDTLQRILPLTAAALLYRRFFTEDRRLGYACDHLGHELLLGAVVGIPLAAITAAFRRWLTTGYRLPTRADQALQTTYYLAINAPAEELFWRGTVQHLAARLLRRVPVLRQVAIPLGWAVATAGYGAYHRLGGWSWRSIAGVTFAGMIFGALFASRPRERAMVAVTLAHGLTTAAFLSWGDVVLHQLALRRHQRQQRAPGG
ncbi:MAG TPA: CPBP family intramembrane glutamic endopeptidase [Ktedonobacterales bacterium]